MGTRYKGKRKEILALDAWIKLSRAKSSIMSRLTPSMTQLGITVTQFTVLEALLHLGPLSQAKISKKLLLTSGNIVKVIDNLVRDGLVTRNKHPQDRRVYLVTLTEKGANIIENIFPNHVQDIVENFSVLNEKEQQTLSLLCKKLGLGL